MRFDQPATAQAPLGVIGRRIADEVWLKRRDAAFRKADVGRGFTSAGKTRVADYIVNHCKSSRGFQARRNIRALASRLGIERGARHDMTR